MKENLKLRVTLVMDLTCTTIAPNAMKGNKGDYKMKIPGMCSCIQDKKHNKTRYQNKDLQAQSDISTEEVELFGYPVRCFCWVHPETV